jgi:hypothetical protein
VKHAKGEAKVTLDQNGWTLAEVGANPSCNSNQWVLIGDFDFSKGEDQYIELQAEPEVKRLVKNHASQVFADAVRFSSRKLTDEEANIRKDAAPTAAAAMGSAGTMMTPTSAAVRDSGGLSWYNSIKEAQAAATRSGRKILLFFYLAGSVNTTHYDRVFADPAVSGILAGKYELCRLNFTENAKTASILRVYRAGVINIYDSVGGFIEQISDPLEPKDLAAKLK